MVPISVVLYIMYVRAAYLPSIVYLNIQRVSEKKRTNRPGPIIVILKRYIIFGIKPNNTIKSFENSTIVGTRIANSCE